MSGKAKNVFDRMMGAKQKPVLQCRWCPRRFPTSNGITTHIRCSHPDMVNKVIKITEYKEDAPPPCILVPVVTQPKKRKKPKKPKKNTVVKGGAVPECSHILHSYSWRIDMIERYLKVKHGKKTKFLKRHRIPPRTMQRWIPRLDEFRNMTRKEQTDHTNSYSSLF